MSASSVRTIASCPPASTSPRRASAAPSIAHWSSSLTTKVPWKNAITVWRNNHYTPVFDTSYIYRISPLNGGQSLDVYGESTAIGTTVQQYSSWDGVPQKFTLVPDGPNWRIAMTVDLSKLFQQLATRVLSPPTVRTSVPKLNVAGSNPVSRSSHTDLYTSAVSRSCLRRRPRPRVATGLSRGASTGCAPRRGLRTISVAKSDLEVFVAPCRNAHRVK